MSIKKRLPLWNLTGIQIGAAEFDRPFLYFSNDLKLYKINHQVNALAKVRPKIKNDITCFNISFNIVIFLFRLQQLCKNSEEIYFLKRTTNHFSYRKRRKTDCIIIKSKFVVILKPLYDGTLVNIQTTALRAIVGKSYPAQLILLWSFFVLTTLTRCYADSSINVDRTTLTPRIKIHSSILVSKLVPSIHPVQNSIDKSSLEKTNARKKREFGATLLNQIPRHFRTSKQSKKLIGAFNNRKYTDENLLTVRNGVSEGVSVANSTSGNFSRKNELVVQELNGQVFLYKKTVRPMSPAHDHDSNSSLKKKWLVVAAAVCCSLLLTAIALLGIVTCIVSQNRSSGPTGGRGTASDPHNAAPTPTQAPMLSVVSAGATAGVGGMDHHRLRGGRMGRELAAARDRQVRLAAITTDLQINLPPSIQMPDGEDHPYNSRLIQIRDAEQEAEIYQKCIRPPPNRTVLESESPPPYRSSSAGYLASSSTSSCSDWSSSTGTGGQPLVVRCNSMSSSMKRPQPEAASSSAQKTDFLQRTVKIFTGKKTQTPPPPAPTLPAVTVPSRHRRTTEKTPKSGV